MTDNEYTLSRAKIRETRVTKILNDSDRGMEYTLHPNKYSHYDISGVGEDKHLEIIEVKERTHNPNWRTWFIEVQKIDAMFEEEAKANKRGETMDMYLAIVSNGSTVMYDIRDIIEYPVENIKMNKATAKGFRGSGEKVYKDVYDFPKSLKSITLE